MVIFTSTYLSERFGDHFEDVCLWWAAGNPSVSGRVKVAAFLVASMHPSHRSRFCASPSPAPTASSLICKGRNVRLVQVLERDFTGLVRLLLFASLVFKQHVQNAQSASRRSSGRKEEAHAEYK